MQESFEWYFSQSRDAAARFILAVDSCIASVQADPELYPVVFQTMRRALVPGFPFAVFYTRERGRSRIRAVMHDRRDPRDWQERL